MSSKSRNQSFIPYKIIHSTPNNSISNQESAMALFFHNYLPNKSAHGDNLTKLSTASSVHQQQISRITEFIPKEIPPSQCSHFANKTLCYFFDKAFLCSDKFEYDNAILLYNKVLSMDENNYEALNNIGICHMKKKHYLEALVYLEKALCLRPSLQSYMNKAIACLEGQMYDQVIETVERGILSLESNSEELHKIRTAALLQSGKISPALKDLDQKFLLDHHTQRVKSKYTPSPTPIQKTYRSRKHFLSTSPNELLGHFPSPSPLKVKHLKDPNASSHRKVFSSFDFYPKNSSDSSTSNKKPKRRTILRKKPHHQPPTIPDKKEPDPEKTYKLNKLKLLQLEKLEKQGLIQKDLSQGNLSNLHNFYKTFGTKDPCLDCDDNFFQAQEDLAKLRRSIEDFLITTVNNISDIQISKIPTMRITEHELEFLLNEFDLPNSMRKYGQIDDLLSRLEFFNNYDEDLRKKIYELSKIACYRPGETVFNQGDKGETLYVIIKGSVNIIKTSNDFGGYALTVDSIYDGSHFGDIALMNALKSNNLTLRTATCEACERTYLLAVPKDKYQKMLIEVQLKNVEDKTCFFRRVPVFKDIESKHLIALACYTTVKKYALNDIIQKKGEIPEGMNLVISGHVDLITEGYTIRDLFGSEFANARIHAFVCANYQGVRVKKRKSKSSFDGPYKNIINLDTQKDLKKFMPKDHNKDINKNAYILKDEMIFASLQPGDFFGGRVLLSNEKSKQKSKFTIVAKSNLVEIILITKSHLFYLPDEIKSQLRGIIEKSYEIDCPEDIDPGQMDKLFIQWQDYRKECVESIRRNKFIERNPVI
ncbi:hypothetical protein SteCoe_5430 [Stentor coeruleus]|uniref:Cyclic nucleotide-binding domain-containing protein n=1 Tax=Stentor coeruleus TaxID=5963 RepID=A0A1R2CSA1_9CILI|nr:hypothetical protein SteCoe_5430 [Stentor coeruleus]